MDIWNLINLIYVLPVGYLFYRLNSVQAEIRRLEITVARDYAAKMELRRLRGQARQDNRAAERPVNQSGNN